MANEDFFARMLDRKYAQQQQTINSQSLLNDRTGRADLQNAGTNRMNANTNLFTAKSNDVVNRQNANTAEKKVNNDFIIGNRGNELNFLDIGNRFKLGSDLNDINRMDMLNRKDTYKLDRDKFERGTDFMIPLFKRGTARVPGKGEGDKVPAMLEPGEAILNKKAAGMIGRDKIAKANAKGNQMRDKEAQGKVAKLLKMMGMV